MKGMNAVMGWLLMLAVLAVPSFLFYNWWAKNKAPAAAETAPAAVSQDVFPKQESSTPDLAVPAAAAQTPSQQAAGQAAAQPSAQPSAPATQPAGQQASQPPSGQSIGHQGGPGQSTPVGALNTAAQQAPKDQVKPAGGPSTSTTGGYNPKSTRNPMVSVEEFRRIKAEQEERAAEERAARMGLARKAKEPSWETRIRLQGIVGNAAIINGDMFYAGQNVLGGKLVKVSADYIILEYRGKKFTKKLQ